MWEDWDLIESSFLSAYGIRLSQDFGDDEMSWDEFVKHLSNLSQESPLGLMVSIRAESDPDRLKGYNKDQHNIRNQWRRDRDKKAVALMTDAEKEQQALEFKKALMKFI